MFAISVIFGSISGAMIVAIAANLDTYVMFTNTVFGRLQDYVHVIVARAVWCSMPMICVFVCWMLAKIVVKLLLLVGIIPASKPATVLKKTSVVTKSQPAVQAWVHEQQQQQYRTQQASHATNNDDSTDESSAVSTTYAYSSCATSSSSASTIHAVPNTTIVNNNYTTHIHSPIFNFTSTNARRMLQKLLNNDPISPTTVNDDDEEEEEGSQSDETYVPDDEAYHVDGDERKEVLEELAQLSDAGE